MLLQQNDGSVDGHRYFLCHPNRGLFVRISRCRTRTGHSVGDGRHVSFPSRTLGKRVHGDAWNANVKKGSSPPYLLESFQWAGTSPAASDAHQPYRQQPRTDARPNARKSKKWVPIDVSSTGTRRHTIQIQSDSSESSSSESPSSESDASEVILEIVCSSYCSEFISCCLGTFYIVTEIIPRHIIQQYAVKILWRLMRRENSEEYPQPPV